MTFEELAKVNSKIKTTDIKGKAYAEVNSRILAFRKLFPNGTISTDIVSLENGVCVIKATVMNEEGSILGTGYAYEKEGSTFINKTSYIENAETSAVGRALGMVGIGIDTSIASYEEVSNAVAQQAQAEPPKTPAARKTDDAELPLPDHRAELRAFIKKHKLDPAMVVKLFHLNKDSKDTEYAIAKIRLNEMLESGEIKEGEG